MDEIVLENRLTKLESGQKSLFKTVAIVSDTQEEIKQLAISVNTLAINVERLVNENCNFDNRLKEIEKKPAKRWEVIVTTIITATVTLLIGFVMGKFLGG